MLRLLALCVALLAVTSPASAQHTAAAAQPGEATRYWVLFKDKQAEHGRPAAVEPGYLSARALTRRAARASAVPPDVDAPVSPLYLKALHALGVEPLVRSRWLNGVSAYLTPAQTDALRALPFVRELRPVARFTPARTEVALAAGLFPEPSLLPATSVVLSPQLEYGPSEKQLSIMNAITPLENDYDGTGVILGFLDTLFDFDHPVWAQHRAEERILAVRDFTQQNQQIHGANQADYHGLNTSSVAAGFDPGQLIGPGHGAFILAATTEFAPHERNIEEDNFVAGLEWLESQGADVVNASLGYTTFDDGQRSYTYQDLDGDTGITTRAVDRAAALGVVVVTSAGNEGNRAWHYIGTPADADSVIAVGGIKPDSSRADFSSFGPTPDGRIKPDVAALAQIASRDGRIEGPYIARHGGTYGYANGTSFSSPLVAGVVCQLLEANPNLTPIHVRTILRQTASLEDNPNNELGWGIVNADAAVSLARNWDPTVVEPEGPTPAALEVDAVFPTPARGYLAFRVNVPAWAPPVSIALYDVLGRQVLGPIQASTTPGMDIIPVETGDLPGGVYLYRIEGENLSATGTVVLVN